MSQKFGASIKLAKAAISRNTCYRLCNCAIFYTTVLKFAQHTFVNIHSPDASWFLFHFLEFSPLFLSSLLFYLPTMCSTPCRSPHSITRLRLVKLCLPGIGVSHRHTVSRAHKLTFCNPAVSIAPTASTVSHRINAVRCSAATGAGRYVLDFTDHVWAEVYSEHLGRWVHCDPCENAFDSPMMLVTSTY
jgi:hypothetical protein